MSHKFPQPLNEVFQELLFLMGLDYQILLTNQLYSDKVFEILKNSILVCSLFFQIILYRKYFPSAPLFQPVQGYCHQARQISGKRMRFFYLFLCAVLRRCMCGSCNPRIFQRFSFYLPQPFLRLCFLENPRIHRRMPPRLCLCVRP